MNKYSITVPKEIKYISDWQDFLTNVTQLPCILDKKVTGCGFTEWALTNNLNVILCSPRKILLENKESQHEGEVFYFKNELEKEIKYDKYLEYTENSKRQKTIPDPVYSETTILNNITSIKSKLLSYLYSSEGSKKILVTYDSFKYVREVLGEDINNFLIIIDEFQSIFTDAKFKAEVELEFLYYTRDLQGVMYVSATPGDTKYLEQLDEFKDLPYYELDWISEGPERITVPDIHLFKISGYTIQSKASEIIEKYRSGNFEKRVATINGVNQLIESREAVFYVNSVKNICSIIIKANLRPEECNILCANTTDNIVRVRRAFRLRKSEELEIGKVPRYGEQHKMFTFCTRTVYLGADFYSTNARSFVFSDANISSLMVDISIDLPQIMGRQRLYCNPWKNSITLYFKTSRDSCTKQDFDDLIESKKQESARILQLYEDGSVIEVKNTCIKLIRNTIEFKNYADNYVSVDSHSAPVTIPVFNNLILLSDIRAFELQQVDYKDRFSLFNSVSEVATIVGKSDRSLQLVNQVNSIVTFPDKFKCLYDNKDLLTNNEMMFVLGNIFNADFKYYVEVLGWDRIKALSFRNDNLKSEITKTLDQTYLNNLKSAFLSTFEVGISYTTEDIKDKLVILYKSLGIKKLGKASDLNNYFELKACKIKIEDKWIHGFKILSKK